MAISTLRQGGGEIASSGVALIAKTGGRTFTNLFSLLAGLTLLTAGCPTPWGESGTAHAQTGTISIDKDTVTVGDPVTLTLEFSLPQDYRIGSLSWVPGEDTLVQVDSLKVEDKGDSKYSGQVHIALFAPGAYDVSPKSLLLVDKAGDSLKVIFPRESVFVASVLPAEAKADSIPPADYKTIIQPPFAIPWWAWVIAGVVAVAAAAFIWFKRRPKFAVAVAKEIRSPWLVALDKLRELETEGFHLRGESRMFAIELSLIIRQYLEGRYGFEAAEQTTHEIKYAMTHVKMTNAQREAVLEALNSCDLAKYAKFHWPAPELEKALKMARSFVIDTIPEPPKEAKAA